MQSALGNPKRTVETLFVANPKWKQKVDRPCQDVVAAQLEKWLPPGAVHQGIAAWASPMPPLGLEELEPQKGMILALDGVTDPHNVGALWRNAAAFGAQALLLTQHHRPPLEGSVAKSACGAMECVPYVLVSNLVHGLLVLKKKGFFCVGLGEDGDSPLHTSSLWPVVLVVGAEGKGLRRLTRTHCDVLLSIGCSPTFTTLNASVAGALALYHFYHQGKR